MGAMATYVTESDSYAGFGSTGKYFAYFGLAAGFGATVSTSLGGTIADRQGSATALAALACAGLASVLLLLFAFPETRLAKAEASA